MQRYGLCATLATMPLVVAVRILGIDPGTQLVGFGCLELSVAGPQVDARAPLALRTANTVRAGASSDLTWIDCGVLHLGRNRQIPDRLLALSDQLRALIQRLRPTEIAIEEAFYGKSASAALRIGEARGVILAESARAELAIHQYAPARVKRCVAGAGNASKDAVAVMVQQQLGIDLSVHLKGMTDDATDALAVAFTRVEEWRSPMLREEKLASALGEPIHFLARRRR
ncbi:MAG: hypothetical protein EXS02_14375 [Planctomycetes bacterium]|nr:hypothetical protein [Planctomycetota bacterium]